VSTVSSGPVTDRDIGESCATSRREINMAKKASEGVPALQNEDVTGMTEEKQEQVIRESGRAPRSRAAEEFYEEGEEQAARTPPSGEAGD
jgi:hypothetical protein